MTPLKKPPLAKRIYLTLFGVLVTLSSAFLAYSYAHRADKPVLYAWTDCMEDMCVHSIKNPFRDRKWEDCVSLIYDNRNSICQNRFEGVSIPDIGARNRLCKITEEYPITNYHMVNLKYKNDKVFLLYLVKLRSGKELFEGSDEIYLDRTQSCTLDVYGSVR